MRCLKFLAPFALAGLCLAISTPQTTEAQVSVSVGVAPACPYGYYEVPPYNCAPYGYYGSEWFSGGVFVGAGPWFHGPEHFSGHVNTQYHPEHGYHGDYPKRGEKPRSGWNGHPENFHGTEMHDEHGHPR